MQVFRPHGWACDRARQAVSLRLDSELSELELRLLEAHLERCPACAEFAEDVILATRTLRAAPLESLAHPVELPRRRVAFGVRRATAGVAMAAAAAAALLAVTILPNNRVQSGPAPTPTIVPSNNEDLRDQRILQRAQMKPVALILNRSASHGPAI